MLFIAASVIAALVATTMAAPLPHSIPDSSNKEAAHSEVVRVGKDGIAVTTVKNKRDSPDSALSYGKYLQVLSRRILGLWL
jgi:hypothetical protein